MSRVLIIGAGGVGHVVANKCAQVPEVFSEIHLASRTKSKCDAIAADVLARSGRTITTHAIDADNVAETTALLEEIKPSLLINVALPYQDLALMDACLAAGVDYLDTANYEPPDVAKFEYKWQWEYQDKFVAANRSALLGSGFDPGVTNVWTAWAAKHHFDEIHYLDIVDVNGGDHGKAFATNFNPEINIREVTAPVVTGENGSFVETPAMSVNRSFSCPEEVGTYQIYRMYHEELESIVTHFPTIRRARFWMSFSENYLNHLKVLQNVGMTRIDPCGFTTGLKSFLCSF
jgi:saccharopine dehydrogenase (NAD+, L-lysine forming)